MSRAVFRRCQHVNTGLDRAAFQIIVRIRGIRIIAGWYGDRRFVRSIVCSPSGEGHGGAFRILTCAVYRCFRIILTLTALCAVYEDKAVRVAVLIFIRHRNSQIIRPFLFANHFAVLIVFVHLITGGTVRRGICPAVIVILIIRDLNRNIAG